MKKVLPRLRGVALFTASLIVILGVWEWASATEAVSRLILPAPLDVFDELKFYVQNLTGRIGYWHDTWVTFQEIVIGFGLAALTGFGLGTLVSESRLLRDIVMPYVVAFNGTPKVAFVPILVVWLGFGIMPKVLLAAMIAFFPVFVNTVAGMQNLQVEQIELMRSLHASRWQMFRRLRFFNALPYVFAGLKTAMVLAVIGAIVAEFGGASQGIGYLINLSASRLRTDQVFAFIIVLSVMAWVLFTMIDLIERRVVFWAESRGGIDAANQAARA